MHELSIAMGVVELAEKEALKGGGAVIESIELEIGKLSGIEIEALEFAWPVAVKGTMLANAKRIIFSIAGKAKCADCGLIFDIDNLFDSCPSCNSYIKEIFKGKELRIKAITVDS